MTGGGAGDDRNPVPFYTVHDDASFTFALRTADRRAWKVTVPVDTAAAFAGLSGITRSDIERLMVCSVPQLEFAALRLISRGEVDGDCVTLTPASLRI